MNDDVRTRGTWPGPIVLRRGFALAHARPWNDQTHDVASMRLIRGNHTFVASGVRWLTHQGVVTTRSPALSAQQTAMWRRAGFSDHLQLDVYERTLGPERSADDGIVVREARPNLETLTEIDDLAFAPLWRVGHLGLEDALRATSLSVVLTVPNRAETVGFLIAGVAGSVAYLQRLAVRPEQQGRGLGSSLVRSSLRWAWRSGARTMLLNTQPENRASARLYVREGFHRLDTRLHVLARRSRDEAPSG